MTLLLDTFDEYIFLTDTNFHEIFFNTNAINELGSMFNDDYLSLLEGYSVEEFEE